MSETISQFYAAGNIVYTSNGRETVSFYVIGISSFRKSRKERNTWHTPAIGYKVPVQAGKQNLQKAVLKGHLKSAEDIVYAQ